ncbi:MAG TPA: M36 family metallopeptidase, partial [Mycobacteriales bacterium]|nr:M36 family metallopeptidase [Mycobacteriales bacterium]
TCVVMSMRRRGLLAVLAALLTVAAAPAVASRPGAYRVDHVGAGIVRGDLGPALADPLATAAAYLRTHAATLGVDPASFRFESVRRSVVGTHVRGREHRGSVPVSGTVADVHVIGGRVVQVAARSLAGLPGVPARSPLASSSATTTALRVAGIRSAHAVSATRELVRRGARLVDTWRIAVVATAPAYAGTIEIDAGTGRLLGTVDDARRADGSATLFDPNPVVSTRDRALRQPGETGLPTDADLDSAALAAARVTLPLRDLEPGALPLGRLAGPWVDVTVGVLGTATSFQVTRSDPRFEGLMAYAHIDRLQRYLQSLGFTGAAAVNAEPQQVLATRLEGFDQSLYYGGTDTLVFGAGGVDDGEDAEIIAHEYGHAMQFAQVPGFTASGETGAMGEGFGDFLAGAFYAGPSRGFGDLCVGEWDATTYMRTAEPCLRRLDSPKTYPASMTGEVHDDGEIWSAFLWRLRNRLGGTAATRSAASIRLVVASHELLTSGAGFGEGVAALRTAAAALRHPEWRAIVDAEARRSGLPLNP